jgi:hypothetical protein
LYQLIRQLLETRVDVPLMIEGLNAIQPLSEGNNLEISATGVRADVRRGRTANTHSTTYEKQARLSFQAYPSSYLKPVVVPEVRTHVLQNIIKDDPLLYQNVVVLLRSGVPNQ